MTSAVTEQRRTSEIERYHVLDEPPERDLHSLVELVTQVCGVPTAAINIITRTQQQQVATVGFDPAVCTREDSMCAAVVEEPDAVVIRDATLDPRFAANPFVNGEIGDVRFYASAPVVTPDGVTLGRLCVFDDVPRELTDQQVRGLETLAGQVMDVLELRYQSRALKESVAELLAARDELRHTHQHLALFADQVSHDLRGPLAAIIASANELATQPSVENDDSLVSLVDDVSHAGLRMSRMVEAVLQFALGGGGLRLGSLSLDDVVALVLADLAPLVERTGATVVVGDLPLVTADADMLYSVVLSLVTHALGSVRPGTALRVELTATRRADAWRFTVSDDGALAPERIDSVFELDSHGAAGLVTTRRLVEAHGGRVGAEESAHGAAVWFELPA